MTHLLHISSSPRGTASQSLALAERFVDHYRDAHPDHQLTRWDLWDGTLPAFGPAAAAAKMATMAGEALTEEQSAAWRLATDTFARFDAADRYLFSVPMWNATIPYILKQFVDVVSQPGLVFGFDPEVGYSGLLAGKKATVIYTSGVYAPGLPPSFGSDFQQPYLTDWLAWAGISDVTSVRLPAATGGADAGLLLEQAHAEVDRAAAEL